MQQIKKFSELPWTNPTYDNPWYAGYDAPDPIIEGHRIYVPKEKTLGCITAAFGAAYQVGDTMAGIGQWAGFKLTMEIGQEAGQTVGWPYIHLIPVNPRENN